VKSTRLLAPILFAAVLGGNAATALAADYILRAPDVAVAAIAARHGLTIERSVAGHGVCLVSAPDSVPPDQLTAELLADADVGAFEPNGAVRMEEGRSRRIPMLSPATTPVDRSLIDYFGAPVWTGFVQQPGATLIHLHPAHARFGNGTGIVAVIDTGIDVTHPVISGSLVDGFDFLSEQPGIPAETAISVVSILDGGGGSLLSPAPTVNPSTVSILDSVRPLDPTAVAFGHGTMVAGLVHLVAPAAQIMPLKAFRNDGTASLFDIVRAIYFAVDHGARILNMSFSMTSLAPELLRALTYATSLNVIPIAAVGNEGIETLTYPAALRQVVGVGATDLLDRRSAFSNYGNSLVTVAAPGEQLVTAYPDGRYAMVWGTSFSTALVSGEAALMLSINPQASLREAMLALDGSINLSGGLGLGEGRIDLLRNLSRVTPPPSPSPATAPALPPPAAPASLPPPAAPASVPPPAAPASAGPAPPPPIASMAPTAPAVAPLPVPPPRVLTASLPAGPLPLPTSPPPPAPTA
jgi:hypothetical protein